MGSVLGRTDSLTIQEEQLLARKEGGGREGESKKSGLETREKRRNSKEDQKTGDETSPIPKGFLL